MNKKKVLITKGRILTEEDYSTFSRLLSPYSHLEITIVEGQSIFNTISEIGLESIPVIIADIQTYTLNGFTLVRLINSLFFPVCTRFILVGNSPEIDSKLTTEVGGYFLEHPLKESQFIKLVEACLAPRRQSRQFLLRYS